MRIPSVRTPSYRLHKPSGQAVVTIDGKDLYLGKIGTPESRAEYDRLLAEWLCNGRRLAVSTDAVGSDFTINELLVRYFAFADIYYTKAGKPTRESIHIRGRSARSVTFTAIPSRGTSAPWR